MGLRKGSIRDSRLGGINHMAAGGPMHVSTIAAFCLAAGLLNAQSAVSVLDYGASNNGTNVSQTTSAFSQAFTAAGPYGKIRVPPGDYLVDNSTGPFVVTNFSGELNFEGQARLIFIANTKGGLWFTGGAGAKISGLHVTYQIAPSGRIVGQEQVKFSATTDSFVQNIRLENSPSAGLLFYDCIRPKVHDAVVVNSKADGVHFANCEDSQIVNLTTNNTGDDGLAFLNYAAGTNRLGGNARNIVIRASRARGITVVGQSDVVVSGFLIDGTSSSGILCGYDSSYNTRVPDKVRFDTGTIKNAGTVTPVIGNRYGIEYEQVISCSFSNIEVHSSASRGFSGSAPSGRITLSNIRVKGNATGEAFQFYQTNQIEMSDCTAENTPSYGFAFVQCSTVIAKGLAAINTSQLDILHRAIWFANSATVLADNLKVLDTQGTATGYIVGASQATGYTQSGIVDGVSARIVNGTLSVQNSSNLLIVNLNAR